jgi:hypothetical protein
MTTKVNIAAIRIDGATQSREVLRDDVVDEYADQMRADGAVFPPVVVFYDGTDYFLADGFHRVAAAKKNGAAEIACIIKQGDRRDAILYSVGANADHGLRRTNADKRRAIGILLRDPEWSKRSDNWIADACRVSDKTIAAARRDFGIPKSTTVKTRNGRAIDATQIGTSARSAMPDLSVVDGSDTHVSEQEPHAEVHEVAVRQLLTAVERLEKLCAKYSKARAAVRAAGKKRHLYMVAEYHLAKKMPASIVDAVDAVVAKARVLAPTPTELKTTAA